MAGFGAAATGIGRSEIRVEPVVVMLTGMVAVALPDTTAKLAGVVKDNYGATHIVTFDWLATVGGRVNDRYLRG